MTQPEAGNGIAFGVELKASIESLRAEVAAARKDRQALNDAVAPIEIPALNGVPVSGALTLSSPELWGPRRGKMWFFNRITVDGLAGGAATGYVAGASVTSPGATTTIASVALPPGTWSLTGTTLPSGTLAALDNNNLRLQQIGAGGGTKAVLPLNAAPSPNEATWGPVQVTVTNTPTTTIAVQSIVAATSGAVYYALISAVPVPATTTGDVVRLYRGAVAPQNHVHTFQSGVASEWWPGGDFYLSAGEYLTVAGTGLVSTSVTVSADVDEVASPWVGAYRL